MLGEKSLNKYARAGEIYVGTLGPDSALFTTTQLRLKSQSFYSHMPPTHRSLSLTPELSHYIRSCMGLSCMLKVPFFTNCESLFTVYRQSTIEICIDGRKGVQSSSTQPSLRT
jgi:hypothetical protein